MKYFAAVLLLAAFPVFAASPGDPPALDAPELAGDAPRVDPLDVELVPAGTVTTAPMACFKTAGSAVTWTRAARACELERDGCLQREAQGETGRLKWALLGAGIGVTVSAIVFGAIAAAAKLGP